jgi:hypothetical protein
MQYVTVLHEQALEFSSKGPKYCLPDGRAGIMNPGGHVCIGPNDRLRE